MKKFLFTSVMAAIFFSAISFTNSKKHVTKAANDWGEWIQDDCFNGIDYRVRKGDYNSYSHQWYWYAQIRNRYNKKVNISYIISEPGEIKTPNARTIIEAGGIDGAGEVALLNSSERCHVRVGYLRFGDDDSGSYYNCDK